MKAYAQAKRGSSSVEPPGRLRRRPHALVAPIEGPPTDQRTGSLLFEFINWLDRLDPSIGIDGFDVIERCQRQCRLRDVRFGYSEVLEPVDRSTPAHGMDRFGVRVARLTGEALDLLEVGGPVLALETARTGRTHGQDSLMKFFGEIGSAGRVLDAKGSSGRLVGEGVDFDVIEQAVEEVLDPAEDGQAMLDASAIDRHSVVSLEQAHNSSARLPIDECREHVAEQFSLFEDPAIDMYADVISGAVEAGGEELRVNKGSREGLFRPVEYLVVMARSELGVEADDKLAEAVGRYALGGISEGKAAEIAGITRWRLREILEEAGIELRHGPQTIEGVRRDAGLAPDGDADSATE